MHLFVICLPSPDLLFVFLFLSTFLHLFYPPPFFSPRGESINVALTSLFTLYISLSLSSSPSSSFFSTISYLSFFFSSLSLYLLLFFYYSYPSPKESKTFHSHTLLRLRDRWLHSMEIGIATYAYFFVLWSSKAK